MAQWQKGKSGNPNGRPKKGRALTETLERVCGNGKKKAIAEKIREGILTGCITFDEAVNPDNGQHGRRIVKLDSDEWLQLVKFVFAQVDGPPPTRIAGEDGGDIVIRHIFDELIKRDDSGTAGSSETGGISD